MEQVRQDMSAERGMQIDKVCSVCGSDRIRLTAWMEWSVDDQRWRLSSDSSGEDSIWCRDCENETGVYEQEW